MKSSLLVSVIGTVILTVTLCFIYFAPWDSPSSLKAHEIGTIHSYEDGSVRVTHYQANDSSQYEIFWHDNSNKSNPRLLSVSDTFPQTGRLQDGRIWIIELSSGDINLRIQRLEGGWNAIHCPSEEAAIVHLANMTNQ